MSDFHYFSVYFVMSDLRTCYASSILVLIRVMMSKNTCCLSLSNLPTAAMMLSFSASCWHKTQRRRLEVWCWWREVLLKSITNAWIVFSLPCLHASMIGGGGFFVSQTLKSQSITLHFIAKLSQWQQMEKADKRGGEKGVAKRPVVTLMEWKQKPGVWLKHPAWSKAVRNSQSRQGCFLNIIMSFLSVSCKYPTTVSSWHANILTNK